MNIAAGNRQRLDLLIDHAPVLLLVNLLVPILASIPLAHEVPLSILMTWCGVLGLVALARFLLLKRYAGTDTEGSDDTPDWENSYVLLTMLQGMGWGVGSVVLLLYATGFNQALLLVLIAGISAGAIPMLGASMPAYNVFLASSMVPVIVWLISKGEAQYWILSAIALTFAWVCFVGARRFNTVLTRNIRPGESAVRSITPTSTRSVSSTGDSARLSGSNGENNKKQRAGTKLEPLVTTLCSGFVRYTVDEIDDGIEEALAKIGKFAQADRVYIYLFDETGAIGSIAYQWSEEDVSPRGSTNFHQLPHSISLIKDGRGSYAKSESKLPPEAQAERDMFERDVLKSWYAVPMITDGDVRGFVGLDALRNEIALGHDVTRLLRILGTTLINALERKRAESKIQHQRFHDPLTALPNRRLFMEHVEQAFEKCRRSGTRGAVLFIDVDYFKSVNDSLGHAAGDLLLKKIAKRLQTGLRGEDIAARLGGDEFVVLLSEVVEDAVEAARSAFAMAQRLHSNLSAPYRVHGQDLRITVSMGVALFPSTDSTSENIVSKADAAMYRAKGSGRNTIQFFEHDIQRKAKERQKLHQDLRDAVTHNRFVFYHQSQVNSHRNVVTDELLLRWNNASRGLVSPGDFIPLAEGTGLMTQIEKWVVQTACQVIRQQKSKDRRNNITYAINVSSAQFCQKGFEEWIVRALDENGLNGGFLEIELTEAVVMEDQDSIVKKMRRLKNLGVRIAVDGFGVGHFSLASLKHLPLDKIKIDRSFVQGVDRDPNDAAIVDAIVSVARNFDLEIVAVGVENDAQFEFLRSQGVGLFQGHYFDHPRPLESNYN